MSETTNIAWADLRVLEPCVIPANEDQAMRGS